MAEQSDESGKLEKRDQQIAAFFTPETLPLYRAVEEKIRTIVQAEVEIKKTQVSFGTTTQPRTGSASKFAWVWLPIRRMKNRPEHYVILTIALGRRIESPRFVECLEPYPGRWTHHLIIQNVRDVDAEVEGWLREAVDFAEARAHSRSRPRK